MFRDTDVCKRLKNQQVTRPAWRAGRHFRQYPDYSCPSEQEY